jgi:hypothetical protein
MPPLPMGVAIAAIVAFSIFDTQDFRKS